MLSVHAYPNNYHDYSDVSFSHSTQPLFAFDDPWSVGHYDTMSVPHDTLPSGLDAFGELTDDFYSDDFSSDVITDDEVSTTPPPSSPPCSPHIMTQYAHAESPVVVPKLETFSVPLDFCGVKAPQIPVPAQNFQQRQLYLQYQQYQYQLLQQKLLMSTYQFPPAVQQQHVCPPVPNVMPPAYPSFSSPDVPRDVRPHEDMRFRQPISDASLKLTSLDASHFGSNITPYPKLKSIPMDISGNLTDAQYNKIFKKYHLHLQLDSHPTMTEQDLEDIKVHGRMYFLKNVKTIVPKVGPWKFNAHISHRRSDERQYNIPGMAVTCKVKEWLTDDGLWRLYHYKRGKTVKVKKERS